MPHKDPEQRREYQRMWQRKNSEAIRARHGTYHLAHKDELNARGQVNYRRRRDDQPRKLPPDTDTKPCTRCGMTKPLSDFYPSPAYLSGRQSECKTCNSELGKRRYQESPEVRARARASGKAWRENNPEKVKASSRANLMRRKYGMERRDYDALYDQQAGCCATCGTPGERYVGRGCLQVDHDHTTGTVRGLLCRSCNCGLGLLGDSAERIRLVLAYLEQG